MVTEEMSEFYSLEQFIVGKTTPLPNYTRGREKLPCLNSQQGSIRAYRVRPNLLWVVLHGLAVHERT